MSLQVKEMKIWPPKLWTFERDQCTYNVCSDWWLFGLNL